ncbi:MAG: hypothetical protein J6S26_00405 [Solobacterium sp.]|nr:hypothetical protein [Solobacterium sp.]
MTELMKFNDFRDYAKEEVVKYLPEELRGNDLAITRFTKIGCAYYSLSLQREEEFGRAAVNLDESYERYTEGENLETIVREMAETLQEVYQEDELASLKDFRFVRPRLFLRVCSRRWNQELLEDVLHRIREDLALTSHILIEKTKENVVSTIIRKPMLDVYGITEEELFHETMQSAPILFPPKITLFQEMKFPKPSRDPLHHPDAAVLTNENGINGASALFYPGMMEEAAEFMGGGYYVAPLSIHEMILIRDGSIDELEALRCSLLYSNCWVTHPKNTLSNQIYHYDPSLKQFSTADPYVPYMPA